MQAGKLRHRVTFQRNIAGRNPASGAPLPPVWQDVAIVWAAVEPLSGRDLIAARAAQSEAKKRVIIRYRGGIEPTMRIVHRGAIYNIVGEPLEDKISGQEQLTILVSAGLNNG